MDVLPRELTPLAQQKLERLIWKAAGRFVVCADSTAQI